MFSRKKNDNDVVGFISGGFFFWKRSGDGTWCCIHPACGPQQIDQQQVELRRSRASALFWPGDVLEFKL